MTNKTHFIFYIMVKKNWEGKCIEPEQKVGKQIIIWVDDRSKVYAFFFDGQTLRNFYFYLEELLKKLK